MAALQAVVVAVALTGVAAYYDQSSPTLQQVAGVPAPDPETSSFLLPRLAHKYRPPTGDWLDVSDPRLYLLTENENDDAQQEGARRLKRTGLGGGPSLSIVNPLDVLRQRLLLEIARRRMRQSEEKIQANREWLKSIGKRSVSQENSVQDTANKLSVLQNDASNAQQVSAPRWTSAS